MSLSPGRLSRAITCSLMLLLVFPGAGSAQSGGTPDGSSAGGASAGAQPQAGSSQSQGAPVGTAAAPVIRSTGNPASAPAGAAIAPAKQRRARSYALRVGLIIGAAVAVGVVAAASLSSSSRPH